MEDKLNASFTQAANALSAFYRESESEIESAYYKGKASVYKELFEWMVSRTRGDLRYMDIAELESHIRSTFNLLTTLPSTLLPIEATQKRPKNSD